MTPSSESANYVRSSEKGGGHNLRSHLHEIVLETPDPSASAKFYERALGFRFEPHANVLSGVARDRRLGFVLGDAKRLASACYVIDDPDALDRLATRLRNADANASTTQYLGLSSAIQFDDPDGHRLIFGLRDTTISPVETSSDPVSARPARLQHLVLASTDAVRLLDFYRDVVGFQLSDRVVDERGVLRTAFLRCGDEHHSLAVFTTSENRLDHFCFEAGDWALIRDWADHFAAQHIPLKWGPGRHGPGNNLFLFVHDPDGNWLEISAELEHVPADRTVGIWRHEERTLNSWGIGFLRS